MLGIFIPPFLAGTVVFVDSLKPSDLIEAIRRERISVLVAVPRFIASLQRETRRQMERDGRVQEFDKNFAIAEKERFIPALVAVGRIIHNWAGNFGPSFPAGGLPER